MNKKIPIILGLLIFGFILWIQTSSIPTVQTVVQDIQNIVYDWNIKAYSLTQNKLQTNVVIVDIDDKSLASLGRWPWPRDQLADLIEKIQQKHAAVITLDLIFPQEQKNISDEVLLEIKRQNLEIENLDSLFQKIHPVFAYDKELAATLNKSDTVVGFGFSMTDERHGKINAPLITLTPQELKGLDIVEAKGFIGINPILAASVKNMGFVNYLTTEGIIRRVPLVMLYQNGIYPSLALETARVYLLTSIQLITAPYSDDVNLEGIKVGGTMIPTDEHAQAYVPFRGPSYTFPYFSAMDVLNDKIPRDAFDGKIVLIGTSATGLSDIKATSVSNAFPGVEIQATIIDGILKNNFWYKPAWSFGAEAVATFVLGCLLVFLYPFLRPAILILLTFIIPIVLFYLNHLILTRVGLILSVLFPMVLSFALSGMNFIYGYLFESRHRHRLNEMFGQYVPKEHIEEMLHSSEEYGLHGEVRDMSVLFSDIRGFTHISETMSAEQLKEMLNEIFTPLTEVIFNTKGTIDKYIGDSIMAFWGAPLTDIEYAKHAICAALEMQYVLRKLDLKIKEHGWPEIKIGIGVNAGKMTVGDMGSKYRRNYTVIGDEVNLASRVEGLTKFYGVHSIATDEIQRNQVDFVFRRLDKVRAVGKSHPTIIYEICCYQFEASDEFIDEVYLSNQALEFYFNREWQRSLSLFKQLLKEHPKTKFYKLYVERNEAYLKTPPPLDWSGVYVHTGK